MRSNSFSPHQSFIHLREMHLESPACFPSCTKTAGLETARHMTHRRSVLGVQLERDLNTISGDIAPQPVSRSITIMSEQTGQVSLQGLEHFHRDYGSTASQQSNATRTRAKCLATVIG